MTYPEYKYRVSFVIENNANLCFSGRPSCCNASGHHHWDFPRCPTREGVNIPFVTMDSIVYLNRSLLNFIKTISRKRQNDVHFKTILWVHSSCVITLWTKMTAQIVPKYCSHLIRFSSRLRSLFWSINLHISL